MTDSAIPATLTAVHLAMAVLRRHRAKGAGPVSPFVLPSFLFAAAPWVWPSVAGLLSALVAHVAWFVACELLAPPAPRQDRAAAAPGASNVAAGRPAPPVPAPAPSAPVVRKSAGRGFVTTSVLAVLEEAPDIRTFRLARPEGFDFAAGQFVAVRVQIDGKPHVRCYSISSSPDVRGYLEISVRRQGLVSTMLHATVRSGSLLTINVPAGTFVYPANDDRPLVLVAGGIGITPLISMLRYGVSADPARPIVLLYSARRVEDVAFLSELRLLAERHPHVRVALTITQAATAAPWRIGRIDLAMVRQHVPHLTHAIFCICGPEPMIADLQRVLADAGVPAGQIRSEQFETPLAAILLNPPGPRPESDAVAPASGSASGASHRVEFAVSARTITASASQTLLEAAEAEGIRMTSSCRAGVCQACRTRLLGGDADCRSDVLDPDDRAAGFILPCVSWATGDCVLEA